MKLSRTVGYALQATLQLAQAPSHAPVPCSKLAAKGRMPERFLLQILRNLVAHGILESTRGVVGGYALLRSPRELSLLEIIEAVDGPLTPSVALGPGLCEETRCKLDCALTAVTANLRERLAAVRLADLLPTACAAEQNGEAGHESDRSAAS